MFTLNNFANQKSSTEMEKLIDQIPDEFIYVGALLYYNALKYLYPIYKIYYER
jgi:hypothetical protein